ncbi:MAG TPA: YdcF family protein [Anaerolineales bacterium]|nr:YdcF family protein [Anaerolineales bacterium]
MLDQVLELLAEIAKAFFIPGSVPFLLLGLTLGVVLLLMDETRRSRGRGLLAALAVLYWVLSLPVTASTLEDLLDDDYRPLAAAEEAQGASTVVVLGGGGETLHAPAGSIDVVSDSTAYRVLEAERLFTMLGQPTLILSGGRAPTTPEGSPESEAMRDLLVDRGVPPDRIVLDVESGDTHEQAVILGRLLADRQVEDFVLVTSPLHMRRALGAFADSGLHPIPSAAAAASDGREAARFLPSEEGLRRSQMVMREVIALGYYFVRGWLATP